MAQLIYSVITSLDGYVVDESGNFDWAAPDEQVHAFVNDRERAIGTYLYGRRMYDVMKVWQDVDDGDEVSRDYAQLWRAAEKVVYSTTLDAVSTPRTSLRPTFEAEAVRSLVADAERDVSVGGPTLAAAALHAAIVDEVQVFVHPVVVGGGTNYLPPGLSVPLRLLDLHRFDGGVVYLRYSVVR
ncbi:MAG TPA: dihydrofolate reductase family protein [Jatrophihabitans sp.]|jgi:dihydrofolate reductase